ncbi:MAG: amino acid adenylation domain-containing protein, partial [Pseudomonadota bacterium]|nr:amino acid adenylation domain-containing protein [Pseudomonadota bacterium]
ELSARLPGYLLPSGYEQVEQWPLTRSGKIDRRALVRGQATPKRRAPANEVESALLEMWAALLKTDDIGVTDNFFQRGGHSLLATRLASQIRRGFEVNFTLKSLFELPTIEEQADLILAQKAEPADMADAETRPRPLAIPRLEHDGPVALSYAQNSLWLLDQMEGSSASYIAGTSLSIEGELDPCAVERSFSTIVARHLILRTVIRKHDSGPLQEVVPESALKVQMVDLSGMPSAEAEQELLRIAREAKTTRFDLSSDVMLRVHLIKQASDRHALLVHLHHIVCDGWSIGLLIKEFNTFYNVYAGGGDSGQVESALPALAIQYRDYAQWQRERLSGPYLEELVAYWRDRLEDIPKLHALPTDYERPEQPSYRGAVHRHHIGTAVANQLNRICQNHGATFFMGIHAAFAIWLSRYSGSDDIVLGTATASRDQIEVAPLIGFFSNSLVLRSRIEARDTFASCLIRTRTQDIADLDRQQLPFELLAEKLNPERSLTHNPIFQIVLNLDNNEVERVQLHGSDVRGNGPLSYESNFDLTLYAVEHGSGIKLLWRYATDLFKPETIARMAASFETLLSAMVADPDRSLQSLPLAGSEVCTELAALAQGPAASREPVLVPDLIARQARARGDAPALLLEDETLGFSALESRANQLARALVAAGVQVGDRVGVCQERTLDLLSSVIGVMKAGAVYVPLDPGYPDERLAHLLVDAGIGHVLTEAHLAPQLPLSGRSVVLVSSADGQDTTAFESPVTRSSPAYMIYTSGSTGQPKGVVISHGALADKLAALAQHYELDETDRGLLFASMSFDASLSQLLVPLAVGGSVVLRPDGLTEPEALLAYVAAQRVTWMHVVPAYLRQLLEVPDWSGTVLRRVSCGGDVLDRGLQQAWFTPERAGIALYNSYGPTEITITSSSHRVQPDEAVVAIGRPLANTRYWVLDEQGQVLPRGAVGELCIGGSGLADGYWGREAQTQERFVDLEPVPGHRERLYRSGDRVRWNDAGDLEFIGRTDHQVKVRGYRIELGEVEAALQGCSGVSGAVVKVEQESLWAYVSLDSGELAQVE